MDCDGTVLVLIGMNIPWPVNVCPHCYIAGDPVTWQESSLCLRNHFCSMQSNTGKLNSCHYYICRIMEL